jgi:hypothetical protein
MVIPLALTGQGSNPGDVLVQAGINTAARALPPGSDASSMAGVLLGAIRRIRVPHSKPTTTSAEVNSPSAVVTVTAGSQTVSLQVYLPVAHHVAIAGDATDWQPVEMTQQRGGWWVVVLAMPRTVSRLHMRRDDGAWCAIPGLPATPDEYGGTISLLVLPKDGTSHK